MRIVCSIVSGSPDFGSLSEARLQRVFVLAQLELIGVCEYI